MWEELLQLREQYLQRPEFRTSIHRNNVRNLFLYEVLKMTGSPLLSVEFENIISSSRPQHSTERRKAYDLWKAWEFIEKSAQRHQAFTSGFVRDTAARVMKHTGREITTTIGRYDSSLGDFRLGEDYNEIYPLADYRKIPALTDSLCRETYAGMQKSGTVETIRLASDFVYRFTHIKPFGEGNLETAALLMNYIQLYRQEPLLIVFADDYPELLNTLKTGNAGENPEEFEKFIIREQIRFINRQI